MIEASDVTVDMGGVRILSNVDLVVHPGEHVALIGPNGAGKTTLLRVLAGLLPPTTGQVMIDGNPLAELRGEDRAKCMSYLPQSRELVWNLTGGDVAALGLFAWGARRYSELRDEAKEAVDTALEHAGAAPFKDRSVRTLSGGERARVHLARTLAARSRSLMLDEPFASLDMRNQLELMQVLNAECAQGRAIITVLHDIVLAERFATRLIVLSGGKIVADQPVGSGLSNDLLANVFDLKRRAEGGFSFI